MPLTEANSMPGNTDLDELELGFMDDFCSLLQAAHFKVLTDEEWQSACDNDFTVSLSCKAYCKSRSLHATVRTGG